MKIERKRTGRTMLTRVGLGEMKQLSFDGYTLTVHAWDGQGRELRVCFERHEVTRLAAYIGEQLAQQRRALAQLRETTDRMALPAE